ncbi:MAG TPA: TonB-dependent receptor plug domain-containing protein, partial [Longimicrobiales bacterium]
MTRRARLPLLLFALLLPARAAAQFPAELAGRVVEARTSQPIAGALVEAGSARVLTDAAGAFVLRVPEAGVVDVTISHAAYGTLAVARRLESGRTALEVFVLEPAPVSIEGIDVTAEAASGIVIDRDGIERSGAQTLAGLLRGVPGVIVRDASNGGARVSIRGGGADQLLVLVDGAPVNDPLTGEADADAVSLQGVHSVRVLPGAQSARFGGRAATGVIAIETDDAREPFASAALEAGSLGAVALEAEAGTHTGEIAASAGARYRGSDGEFRYAIPSDLGGGSGTRENGDERDVGAYASLSAPLAGRLRVRADVSRIERGLPGPMHAPTPDARQALLRGDVRVGWSATTSFATVRASIGGGAQRVRYDDPAPAFGPAYHDTTDAREASFGLEAERTAGARVVTTIGVGVEARRVELESSALEPGRVTRHDTGVFARAAFRLPARRIDPRIDVAARADRWRDGWIASHEVALRATTGLLTAGLAHRSAFSAPAASDQFFAAGFAIAPNPGLEPERIRSEIELTLSTALVVRDVPVELGASAFRGDVDGMIVWAPDFRFVWSPRNRDVKRSGGEAWLRAQPVRGLELGAWVARARVTYDWAGDADTVQVVYRPRHSAGVSGALTRDDWSWRTEAFYTGLRYATPGHANPLPGYWDVRIAAGRTFRRGPLEVDANVRVDRLL